MSWTKIGNVTMPPIAVTDHGIPSACEHCDGSGWRRIRSDGVERLARCYCWAERRITLALAAAGVPTRYAHARLGDYQPKTPAQTLALDPAKRFVRAFPATRGLWIAGEPGTGKTHLAAAVLRSVIGSKGAGGIFRGAGELLQEIRRTYQGQAGPTETSILSRVMSADVLVLDDVGSDKPSDWAVTTIGSIVNERYNAQRPTIFTTTLIDLPDTTDPRSLTYNLGVRTRSRLCEMCQWINL
jgi:DNA replication protein DnaC